MHDIPSSWDKYRQEKGRVLTRQDTHPAPRIHSWGIVSNVLIAGAVAEQSEDDAGRVLLLLPMTGDAWLDVGGILSYPTADHRYRISGGVRCQLWPQP